MAEAAAGSILGNPVQRLEDPALLTGTALMSALLTARFVLGLAQVADPDLHDFAHVGQALGHVEHDGCVGPGEASAATSSRSGTSGRG